MDQMRMAGSLVRRFKTHDPFRIAKSLGIEIVFLPLHGIRGFYQTMKRCKFIYIDSRLEEQEARFVCAHELGHAMLHRGYNRVFMDTNTYFKVDRYEIEADRFAVDLLFDDDELRDFLEHPVQVAADCMGVSVELAEYRMRQLPHGHIDRQHQQFCDV